MCHIRTQNTNKMLRAICQRQKGMVRAYLSMKNEMTLALQKINIFGYWPFPSPFTFLKISPSSSDVLHSVLFCFVLFLLKSEKIFSTLACYCLCVYVSLLDIRYSEVGFGLVRQDLILLVRCSSNPWLCCISPSSSSMAKTVSFTNWGTWGPNP